MKLRRLPAILGVIASLATLVLIGPVAVAVVLLRSSSDAQGPHIAAQVLIAFLLIALAAAAYFLVSRLTRFILRLAGRGAGRD